MLRARGKCDEAIKFIREYTPNASVAWLWENEGETYRDNGDYRGAINAFQNGILHDPSEWRLWGLLANVYLVNHDFNNSIKTLQIAVDRFPRYSWFFGCLCDTFGEMGDHERMIKTCHDAIQRFPNDYSFYIRLGQAYIIQKDSRSALDCFQTALAKQKDSSMLYAHLSFKAPSRWKPTNPPLLNGDLNKSFIWYYLGQLYDSIGDHASTTHLYDCVIQMYASAIDKPNDWMWQYTGNTAWDKFLHCDVKDEYMCKRPLSDATIWTSLGWLYHRKGDEEKAIDTYKKGMKMEGSDVTLHTSMSKGGEYIVH
jgi:tetratricopeptide (TPR) repeat protein